MSDLMLFGILRMPYEMAMSDELSRHQFYEAAQEAADRIESTVPEKNMSCPCLWTTPCDSGCSCANPIMSRGCDRCCTYGSDEQRKAMAEQIVAGGRKFTHVGFAYDGVVMDDYYQPIEIKDGTCLYITCWTQADLDAAKVRAKELFGEFYWEDGETKDENG